MKKSDDPVKVVRYQENADGTADMTLHLSVEAAQVVLQAGFNAILRDALEGDKRRKKSNVGNA